MNPYEPPRDDDGKRPNWFKFFASLCVVACMVTCSIVAQNLRSPHLFICSVITCAVALFLAGSSLYD